MRILAFISSFCIAAVVAEFAEAAGSDGSAAVFWLAWLGLWTGGGLLAGLRSDGQYLKGFLAGREFERTVNGR